MLERWEEFWKGPRLVSMPASAFKHIIFTRFGIGIQRAAHHERRLAIMKASLVPCIADQTNPNAHWLLVTDSRIPEHIQSALEALRERVPNLHLRTVDPLVEYSLEGLKKEFVLDIAGQDEVVALSRVDDDDAINRRYSEIATQFLAAKMAEGAPLPIAASWTEGLEMFVDPNRGHTTSMPWLAPSIAVLTRLDAFFSPMGTHWKIGQRAETNGGKAYEIDDEEPMWAWLRHKDSDSAEFRTIGRRIRSLPPADDRMCAPFPFQPDELRRAYASAPPHPTPDLELVDGGRGGKTRLEHKMNVLRALAELDAAIRNAETAGRPRVVGALNQSRATIVSVFYSL